MFQVTLENTALSTAQSGTTQITSGSIRIRKSEETASISPLPSSSQSVSSYTKVTSDMDTRNWKDWYVVDSDVTIEDDYISCTGTVNLILIEEMPAYFMGQKNLEDVIVIAQDRVQKVLDERG